MKTKFLFVLIAVCFVLVGCLDNLHKKLETTPSPEEVNKTLENEVPPKLVELLKMPTDLPFKVDNMEASVNDLLNREEMKTIENGEKKFGVNEEKVLGDTQGFPFKEVTYEQYFYGDNIYVSVLAQAGEVEMVYEDPSSVNKLQVQDGSTAEYVDYGFVQQIAWKDKETGVTYIINVTLADEKGTGKLKEKEIINMIESFKYVK